GFVSQRTKRPFDAFLVLDFKTGKVGFEFPPREEKPKKGGKEDAAKKFTKADASKEDLSKARRHGAVKVKR
ncbi:hypothetical protein, partial [Akkermansia muciniphila]